MACDVVIVSAHIQANPTAILRIHIPQEKAAINKVNPIPSQLKPEWRLSPAAFRSSRLNGTRGMLRLANQGVNVARIVDKVESGRHAFACSGPRGAAHHGKPEAGGTECDRAPTIGSLAKSDIA
jgi:hypothetical protein